MKKYSVKTTVLIGMLAAVAYVTVFLFRIPVVMFLKYEPKDVIITIGGFLLGPLAASLISLTVSLVEMLTVSETGPIGALMNLLSSCSFACIASIIYKKRHTLGGAILGLGIGSVVTVCVMLLWNWLITPLYMGQPREAIEALLLPAFLPFNVIKTGLNSALVLLLYKPLVGAIRKTGLAEAPATKDRSSKIGIYLLGAGLLATCILLLLVFQGKI